MLGLDFILDSALDAAIGLAFDYLFDLGEKLADGYYT